MLLGTLAEAARAAGQTSANLSYHARKLGIKANDLGQYRLDLLLKSIGKLDALEKLAKAKQVVLEDASESSEPAYINFEEWRAKKERELALLKKLERERTEAILVEKAKVESDTAQMIHHAKQRLLVIPSKLAPQLAIEDNISACKKMISDAINEALRELSQQPISS